MSITTYYRHRDLHDRVVVPTCDDAIPPGNAYSEHGATTQHDDLPEPVPEPIAGDGSDGVLNECESRQYTRIETIIITPSSHGRVSYAVYYNNHNIIILIKDTLVAIND